MEDCIASLSASVETQVITLGPDGALACDCGQVSQIGAAPVTNVVDTTGAGDLFAAGFLAARCRGRDIVDSLHTGAIAAAEVISHFGARPEADLKQLVNL
jgi:sugar/nucleoside kinase (ribokinase family)